MEKDSQYRSEASSERNTLFVIRRDGPVAICELSARWVRSLLKRGYIKRAGIPSFVEITESGEKYFGETM